MEVLEVTSKQFRENQNIQEKDIVLSPEALRQIDEAAEQIKRGEFVKYTPELAQQLFGDYVRDNSV